MEEEIFRIIENALGLKEGSVSIKDDMNTITEWDSLGFLCILTDLEKRFGNNVAAIDDLASVKSVKEIISILKREGILG